VKVMHICEHIAKAGIVPGATTGFEVWEAVGSNDLSLLMVWYEEACVKLGYAGVGDETK
jgi:hypothetical protein